MTEIKLIRVHWSFWIIGVVTLIWNTMGCINFIMQMIPEMISAYPESEQAIIDGRPLWATAAFAVAVFAGTIGCIQLLRKKSTAYHLFIISLIGVIVTMIHTFSSDIEFESVEVIIFTFMPIVIAAFLIWYVKFTGRKGWINH